MDHEPNSFSLLCLQGGYLAYLAGAHVRPRPAAILSIYGPSTFNHPFVQSGTQLRKQKITKDDTSKFVNGSVTTGWTPVHADPLQPSATEAIQFDESLDNAPSSDDRGILLDYYLQENLYAQVIGTAPELNPLNYMTKDYPPTVIIHGTKDRFVPIDLSILAASRLEGTGAMVRLITIHGADHAFDYWARAADSNASKLWSTYLAPMFRFVDEFTLAEPKKKQKPSGIVRQGFLDAAEALIPEIHSWTEHPLEVVVFKPDPSVYFQCRAVHQYTISELSKLAWGRGDEFILDFGTHRVGYLNFHLAVEGINADAPVRLKLTFGEIPYDVTEDLHPCKSWISTSWVPDETINVDWCPTDVVVPRRHSFRYVRVQVIDTSVKFKVRFENIQVRAVSAVTLSTKVTSLGLKDDLLNSIDSVSILTLRDCMQTVFEDGPRRDRRLWLGDLRLQALTNYCTYRNFPLVRRCLYLFAALPLESGALPACVFEKPAVKAASDYIVDYDALFGSVVYDYARESGDLRSAHDLWDTVLHSMALALTYIDSSGKYDGTRGCAWNFLDWQEGLNKDAAMQGLVIFCCNAVNDLAELLDKPPPYTSIVSKMTTAARSFYSPTQSVFISGPNAQISWASNAWLSLARVLPPEQCKKALLTTMANPDAVRPLTPYLFHYFAEALAISGAEAECLNLMKDYWGGMVKAGADTFWECYDPKDSRASPYGDCHNNSYCHAWSCTPSYLLRRVLKVYLAEDGEGA
jgi:alpha-L-rhamnosidase